MVIWTMMVMEVKASVMVDIEVIAMFMVDMDMERGLFIMLMI